MRLTIIFLILFSTFTCAQDNSILKIEYKATTRGASKYISVTKNDSHFNILNKNSEYKTNKKDWKIILNLLNQIDINQIKNLERPSETSSTDRAMLASIILTFEDKTIESSIFDDGNSPKELKKIVNKLFGMFSE